MRTEICDFKIAVRKSHISIRINRMAKANSITRADKQAVERYRALVKRISETSIVNPFEEESVRLARIARAKTDYDYFCKTYFPHYCTCDCAPFHIDAAYRIRDDKHIKLLLGWGRGLAKSTHINIIIPLWLWINDDLKVMLLVGQNREKADILLSDIQAEFEANQLLIHDFGAQQTVGSWEEGQFITKNDCAFFARGFGQDPRGIRHRQYRPDYISGDDLDSKEVCRNPKRIRQGVGYICEDLIGCGDIRGCRYIQVNNIFAPKTMLTEIRDTRQGFQFIRIDATDADFNPTWTAKYTRDYYVSLSAQVGTLSFQSEYNNSPYTEGEIFTEALISRCWEHMPDISHMDALIGYWDVAYSDAKTADFNAVKVWGLKGDKFWLIAGMVRQCKMADAIQWMYDYTGTLKGRSINWYFESQFWNDALMMVFKEITDKNTKRGLFSSRKQEISLIKAERPKGNKYDRMIAQLPYYQQNRVRYNAGVKTSPDIQTGIAQLMGVEPGYKGHDDSPDADAAAIEILNRHIARHEFKPSFGRITHKNLW